MEIILNCSLGEVFDKMTILEIKKRKIDNPEKLINFNKELNYLK